MPEWTATIEVIRAMKTSQNIATAPGAVAAAVPAPILAARRPARRRRRRTGAGFRLRHRAATAPDAGPGRAARPAAPR
jgi:hypothetical protein